MDNKSKWTDELKKLPGWISGAISFVTAIIGFALLIQGNFQLSIIVIVLLVLAALFVVLVYVVFAKTPPLVEGGRGVYRFQEYRSWAMVGMGIMVLSIFGAVMMWQSQKEEAAQNPATELISPTATSATIETPTSQPDTSSDSEENTATTNGEGSVIELPGPDAKLALIHSFKSQNLDKALSAALSPDGTMVAAGYERDPVHIWDLRDGSLLHRLEDRSKNTTSIAFSNNGDLIATGSRDSTVKLWRASDGEFIRTLEGSKSTVYCVAFSQDNSLVAAGSSKTIVIWQVSNGKLVQSLSTDFGVYTVSISPDNKMIAAGGQNLRAQFWNLQSGASYELPNNDWVRSSAFSPDGQYLAMGAGTRVNMWRTSDASKAYDPLTGHNQPVRTIVFLDNETLVTVSMDLAIRFWQVDTGQRLSTIEGYADTIDTQHLSRDGKILVAFDGESVNVWKVP